MHDDPARYWQDLTANYRRMSDGELLELAEKPEDLTEVAQQVLRDEMKLRKLDEAQPSFASRGQAPVRNEGRRHSAGGEFRDDHIPSEFEPADLDADEDEGDESAVDYTWKTLLCDCESSDRAWQLRQALKRHAIDSWVGAGAGSSTDAAGSQVYVAADQLEHARAVAAQPIPQDIIDDWNTVVPEFELPHCPHCGTNHEVMLESTEPVNSWLCEACGAEWTDPESPSDDNPGSSGSRF